MRAGKYDSLLRFGETVGRLTSLGLARSKNGQREYLFVCQCGEMKWVSGSNVARRAVSSCGCLSRQMAGERCASRKKHGLSLTPIYRIWQSMMARCYTTSCRSYQHYGARGIEVCKPWNDFETFNADIEPIWVAGLEMDRINTEGEYEPDNVRFVVSKVNQRNRRNNRWIEIDGVTKCAAEWAEEYGLKATLFLQRIDRDNMSPKQALTYKKYKED